MTTFERIKKLSKKFDKNLQEVAIEAGLGKNAIYKCEKQTYNKKTRIKNAYNMTCNNSNK